MSLNIRRVDLFLNEKPWLILVFFTALTILLRWSSFYQSVIDWDESLYLLVAQAWLAGNPPYTVIWDNKPPGIYAIFAIAIASLGYSVLSIRILACLFVALTSFFLYKIGSLLARNGQGIGLLSGSLYIISTLTSDGMGANTEIFFTTFVVAAFYLFFKYLFYSEEPFLRQYWLLLVGLLLGIGFEIKYVVLFDFLALLLVLGFAFILQNRLNKKYRSLLQAVSLMCLGFVLPFMTASLYFWLIGHFDDYIYANFTANKLRTVDLKFSFIAPLQAIISQIRINKFFWLAMPVATIYLFTVKTIQTQERWVLSSFIVCFLTDLLCIFSVLRGTFYPHYFLQLLPSLCLVTAYIIVSLIFSDSRLALPKPKQYLALGVLLILLITTTSLFKALAANAKYVYFTHLKGIRHWQDTPALIGEYLKPRITSDDYIYLVDDLPIVYFLTNAKIPTRYAFPAFLLIQEDLPNITGVVPIAELTLILQKQPVYIIKQKNYIDTKYVNNNQVFLNALNQALHQSYHLETSIDGFDLYKSNAKSSGN
jgi:4-amino-4-deoxy-L-arabinose transferase-like glycosyltransferase